MLEYSGPSFVQCRGDHGYVKEQHLMQYTFSIHDQTSTVKTDSVPITVWHLLLEEPLQLDRQVVHDDHANRYMLKREEKICQLLSMILTHIMAMNIAKKLGESNNEKKM